MGGGAVFDEAFDIPTTHQREHHVGLAILISKVNTLHDMGVVAEAAHGLGLAGDAGAAGFVQSLRLDERKGEVAVKGCVVGEVDALRS